MDVSSSIGPYRTIRRLGVGGFATVWLAHDDGLDAPVAVKVLADRWIGHDDVRAKFINEARLLRRIEDDRVVRVYAVDELAEGQPYFVMAWADGGTLFDRLADDPLRYDVVPTLELAIDLAECLALVHSYGIVHRDIKPSNILFRSLPTHLLRPGGPRERLVLGDFGVARSSDPQNEMTGPSGTPAYMAPEQAVYSDTVDSRADIFSATAVLYELLTGQSAFFARDRGPAPDGRRGPLPGRDVPPSLAALLDRGMSPDPEARFPTATALAAALRRELEEVQARSRGSRPESTSIVDRTLGADPARAASVLIGHCSSLLPELAAGWRTAGAELTAPLGITVVASAADAATIVGRSPDRSDLLVGTVSPTELQQRAADAVTPSDLLVLAVPAPELESLLAALRGLLATCRDGPVCVLAFDMASQGWSRPKPTRGVVPSAFFELSRDGVDALWKRVGQEVDGWGAWARAEAALAYASQTVERAGPTTNGADLQRQLQTQLAQPGPAEVPSLRAEASGRLNLPLELRAELRRVLGPGEPHARLGLGLTPPRQTLLAAARAGSERWRGLVSTGSIPFAARPAANVVARAYDRLLVGIA